MLPGLALVLASCLFAVPGFTQDTITLVGSGGSASLPAYHRWAAEFSKRKPGIGLQYLPFNTRTGIAEIAKGSGDFGGGETPLTPEERDQAGLADLPIIIIGLVPIYNLPGPPQELRFSGDLLAEIYLGHVKTWSAPQITRLNPYASLPDLPIKVVYQTAGEGPNYIFTDFLSKSSATFRQQVGRSIAPAWPVGLPAERSADVVEKVKSQRGAIGFVELEYAQQNQVPYGRVQNPAGKFVAASPETLAAACNAVEAPQWDKLSASLTNASGGNSYPIASFSWVYVRTMKADIRRRAALFELMKWIFTEGQRFAPPGYSALPEPLLARVIPKLDSMK